MLFRSKSVISETKVKQALTSKNLGGGSFDARSIASHRSKKTLSAASLAKYFDEKKAKIAQDAISRASQISKGYSNIKARAALVEKVEDASKKEDQVAEAEPAQEQDGGEVQAAEDKEKQPDDGEEQKVDPDNAQIDAKTATGDQKDENEVEAVSVVGSAAFDAVSVVPPSVVATEVLEEEYKKLLEEYETIAAENRSLENQVEALNSSAIAASNDDQVKDE